jgi:hypothetical protein
MAKPDAALFITRILVAGFFVVLAVVCLFSSASTYDRSEQITWGILTLFFGYGAYLASRWNPKRSNRD